MGVLYDRRRPHDCRIELMRRLRGSALVGLALLAFGANPFMVDELARPLNRVGHTLFIASGILMTDKKTIDAYNKKAQEYLKLTATSTPDASLRDFMDEVTPGGRILDLGCGPASASAHMRAEGFKPDPVDASPGMVSLANETFNIGARLGTFDDLNEVSAYDGIWANFSLLHAPIADLPRYFNAISAALKPGGILHVGMKTGNGEARDAIDRKYSYVTVEGLHRLITESGLRITHTHEGRDTGLSGSVDAFVVSRAKKDA